MFLLLCLQKHFFYYFLSNSLWTFQKIVSQTDKIAVFVRMCVVVKRKLQLYYWKNNEFLQLLNDDISLKDIPKALSWCEETICVGFRGEYTLFKLKPDEKPNELFPTLSEPCIAKISNNIFVLGREQQSAFVNTQGIAEKTKALQWSDIPMALGTNQKVYL